MDAIAERYIVSSEDNKPVPGQLRGVGNRLDPEGILFGSNTYDGGLTWGYTIIDKTAKPSIFMDDQWTEFVPEGVWLQMIDLWDDVIKTIKDNPDKYEYYLQYPEIKERIEQN